MNRILKRVVLIDEGSHPRLKYLGYDDSGEKDVTNLFASDYDMEVLERIYNDQHTYDDVYYVAMKLADDIADDIMSIPKGWYRIWYVNIEEDEVQIRRGYLLTDRTLLRDEKSIFLYVSGLGDWYTELSTDFHMYEKCDEHEDCYIDLNNMLHTPAEKATEEVRSIIATAFQENPEEWVAFRTPGENENGGEG